MNCPNPECKSFKIAHHHRLPGTRELPEEPEYFECMDCFETFSPEEAEQEKCNDR